MTSGALTERSIQSAASSSGTSRSGTFARFPPPVRRVSATARADALVRDNLKFIWRFLRRLGLPPSDADDATQRVFFAAVQSIDRIYPGSERAFLCSTAAHIALKIRESWMRSRAADGEAALDHLADGAPSAEELSDCLRARQFLDEVLDTMPLELKAVFILFEIEDMNIAEVAGVLGLARGTAASRLRRARADFNQRVNRLESRMRFRRGAR
jgi:RNA polymerase sigma-70 factor (ECF subfamily)